MWSATVHSLRLVALITGLLLAAGPVRAEPLTPDNALRTYVQAPDPAYRFAPVAALPGPGYTVHVLSMDSQRWREPGEVDRTLWTHWLAVVVPDAVVHDTAMVIVAGGDNTPAPDLTADEVVFGAQIAVLTQSVVAIVGQVPNQPLSFPDAPVPLSEDALVAYSWDKAMDTLDWSWPAYLPMVKSVVRTLDTVQAFVPRVSAATVSDFVVVGFSKRGATTWLTAVVDDRVRAIAPGVIDFLNLAPSIEHHYRAYGGYSPAIGDYVDYDIVRRVRIPEGRDLLRIIDPYSYRDLLDLPKYLINSTGDQFFLPDSARFYLDDLEGETLVRYVANTDHGLSGPTVPVEDAVTGLVSWYLTVLAHVPRPHIEWSQNGGSLVVTSSQPALIARLWQADNPAARDFRLDALGPAWTAMPLADNGGVYVAQVEPPAQGWRGFYVELTYAGPGGLPQTYSTPVFVIPDGMPFDLEDPIGHPRGPRYWAAAVDRGEVDPETFAGWFPVPVMGRVIRDADEALALLHSHPRDVARRALRQCLATRLNVAAGELGWYSRLGPDALPVAPDRRYLWRWWTRAHEAFTGGHPGAAGVICRLINHANAWVAGEVPAMALP